MKQINTRNLFMAFTFFAMLFFITSCEEDEETDMQKPEVDLNIQHAFPENCDTLYFGESHTIKVLLKDNAALGSEKALSINIHHNFEHHSHSTELSECELDPHKEPVNPFTFIQNYDIPEGLKEYETDIILNLPAGNGTGPWDEGDYHFFISLTDQEGWSTQKGLSVKMLHSR